MQTLKRFYLFICCFFLFSGIVIAQQKTDPSKTIDQGDSSSLSQGTDATARIAEQTDSLSAPERKKSYFKLGVSYLTDNIYLGRKDSVALPYITPSLGYYNKSGFFIEGSLSYLASAGQSRVDMFSIDGGYDFSAGNYQADIMASKFFYNSQSTSVRSELVGNLAYFNSYDFGFITATATATLNFGNQTDIGGQFGLERTLYAFDDKLNLTPTFIANASTQNYYNSYYKKRRYKIKRKGKSPVTGVAQVTGTLKDASTFKVLDYEISVPLNYHTGKFNFNFTPVFAIPVHPNQVQVITVMENNNSNTKVHTENIESNFFGTIGVTYKFSR